MRRATEPRPQGAGDRGLHGYDQIPELVAVAGAGSPISTRPAGCLRRRSLRVFVQCRRHHGDRRNRLASKALGLSTRRTRRYAPMVQFHRFAPQHDCQSAMRLVDRLCPRLQQSRKLRHAPIPRHRCRRRGADRRSAEIAHPMAAARGEAGHRRVSEEAANRPTARLQPRSCVHDVAIEHNGRRRRRSPAITPEGLRGSAARLIRVRTAAPPCSAAHHTKQRSDR